MAIDHSRLGRLDLNLLVAFDALMSELSVTRAAARVGLGQSAMSHNLARLRTLLGDEVLTRSGSGMTATPRALALIEPLRAALEQIQGAVLERPAFDPASSERTFRIGLPDGLELVFMPPLVARLRETAPGVRLRLRSTDRIKVLDEIDADRLDLGIGISSQGQNHHKRRVLYEDGFLCLYDQALVGLAPPLTLEAFRSLPHVLTNPRQELRGFVEEALAGLGVGVNLALTTPHFLSIPYILRETAMITTLPARVARYFAENLGLTISPVPLELPAITVSLLWHSSYDDDPAHRWLRQTVRELAPIRQS